MRVRVQHYPRLVGARSNHGLLGVPFGLLRIPRYRIPTRASKIGQSLLRMKHAVSPNRQGIAK